jgi:hypothetical protein
MRELRTAAAAVAQRARSVTVERSRVAAYANGLALDADAPADPDAHLLSRSRETLWPAARIQGLAPPPLPLYGLLT